MGADCIILDLQHPVAYTVLLAPASDHPVWFFSAIAKEEEVSLWNIDKMHGVATTLFWTQNQT
jgi:hypothetical protein